MAVSGVVPDVMVVVYTDYRSIGQAQKNTGYAYTTDGGAAQSDWTRDLYIHGITKSDPDSLGWMRSSDPLLVYSAKDDTFKAGGLGGTKNSAVHMTNFVFVGSSKTADAPISGLTWKSPNNVNPSLGVMLNPGSPACAGTFTDRPSMAIDNNSQSPYYGRVYIAWQEINCGDTDVQIWTSHHDVGVTGWSDAVRVSVPDGFINENWGPSIGAGGNNGKVYLAWCRPLAPRATCKNSMADIAIASSTDGGTSWTSPVSAACYCSTVKSPLQGDSFSTGSPPVLAVNPNNSNDLHIVYANFDNGSNNDAVYIHSTNGGMTWSTPIILGSGNQDQFFPHITQSADGSMLWACYYTTAFNNPRIDVSCAKSVDGVTFANATRASTNSFDPGASGWIGDYIAAEVGGNGGYRAAWSATQDGGVNLDVYFGRN
jgi:hypothetical protein